MSSSHIVHGDIISSGHRKLRRIFPPCPVLGEMIPFLSGKLIAMNNKEIRAAGVEVTLFYEA